MLTAPRKISRLAGGGILNLGVSALAVCIQGGLAVADEGYARPGRTGQGATDALKAADAANYRAVGVFMASVTGGTADGDETVDIQAGTYPFNNSAGADALSDADIGRPCYVVDDDTVAKTSALDTRCLAGVVRCVDEDGVWVEVGTGAEAAGRRVVVLPFSIGETDLLAGTSAELVSPVAGNITAMSVIVQKAVTTGGAVTASVDATAVDGLSVAIADAATKGTVASDTPTAGHASRAVAPGSRIQVIPDAAFATAGAVNGFVEISY